MPPLHPEKLTVAQLQRELKKGKVSFPFKAKKDVYVDLYRRHILKVGFGFSSDEDEPISRNSTTTSFSRSNRSQIQYHQTPPRKGAYKIIYQDKLSDVEDMSDRELRTQLQRRAISVGPVVGSTRQVYERKLAKLMSEEVQHGPTRTQSTMVSFHDDEGSDEGEEDESEEEEAEEEEEEEGEEEEEEEENFSDSDLEEEKPISGDGDTRLRRSRRLQALSSNQSSAYQSSSPYPSSRSNAYRTKQPSRSNLCGLPLWFWWLVILAGMAFFIYLIWTNMEAAGRPKIGGGNSPPKTAT